MNSITKSSQKQNHRFIPTIRRESYPRRIRKCVPLKFIWDKVYNKNEDCIVLICGPTGRGKTTLAASLAEELDITKQLTPRFPHFSKKIDLSKFDIQDPKKSIDLENFKDILPRFCYGAEQAGNYWSWLRKRNELEKNTRGYVGVIDEIQDLWSAREHFSLKNKLAIRQLITGRYLNTIHLLIGPEYEGVDKWIRKRVHLIIQVKTKSTDSISGKPYIGWTAHIPITIDPQKPPILRWLRDKNGTVLDRKFYTPSPSAMLYNLVQAKELFWKNLEKDDHGNIINPEKPSMDHLSLQEKKIMQLTSLADKLKESRHDYITNYGGRRQYSSRRICSKNLVPLSWGDGIVGIFQKWDKEEEVDISTL